MNGACKCLQELGILYPEKFKIVTSQYPPNDAQNTPQNTPPPPPPPEDILFRAPQKDFQSLGTMQKSIFNLLTLYVNSTLTSCLSNLLLLLYFTESATCGRAYGRYSVYTLQLLCGHVNCFQTCYLNFVVSSSPGILICSRRCIVYFSGILISSRRCIV